MPLFFRETCSNRIFHYPKINTSLSPYSLHQFLKRKRSLGNYIVRRSGLESVLTLTRTRIILDAERGHAGAIAVTLLIKAKLIRVPQKTRAKRLLASFCVARVELCSSTTLPHGNCKGIRQGAQPSLDDVIAGIDPNWINEPRVCHPASLCRLCTRVGRVLRVEDLASGQFAFEVVGRARKTRKPTKGPACAAIPGSARRNIHAVLRAVARSDIRATSRQARIARQNI